jgi:hypothetical protein
LILVAVAGRMIFPSWHESSYSTLYIFSLLDVNSSRRLNVPLSSEPNTTR